jgi:hypothetical protein
MWSIKDEDAPLVAERFYAYILKETPDVRRETRALNDAMSWLGDKVREKNL